MSALAADARPGLARLTHVELRKMVDTRSGLWLLIATAALTVAITVIAVIAVAEDDRTRLDLVGLAVTPASVLMPIAAILLVTAEWTQRTAMISFALVPQRSRVLAAKTGAGLIVATLACLLGLGVGLAAAAIGHETSAGLSAGMVIQVLVSILVPMLTGLAFGAALLASAPAIVLWFALPIAFAAVGSIHALEDVARWMDMTRTTTPLLEQALSATEWARLGTSLIVWLALPAAVGVWRVARSDVR